MECFYISPGVKEKRFACGGSLGPLFLTPPLAFRAHVTGPPMGQRHFGVGDWCWDAQHVPTGTLLAPWGGGRSSGLDTNYPPN